MTTKVCSFVVFGCLLVGSVNADNPVADEELPEEKVVWDNADLNRKLILGMIRAENQRLLPSSGHYADPKMTKAQQLLQHYLRQMDVDPNVKMLDRIVEIEPSKKDAIEEVFKERIQARSEDGLLLQEAIALDEVDEFFVKIAQKEEQRTLDLSRTLQEHLSADDIANLSQDLVRKFKFRSLAFPLVSQHFGLPDEVRQKVLFHHDKFIEDMASKSGEKNMNPRPFLKAISLLSRSQLVKYFEYDGTLIEGMELPDVVDKFPADAQPVLLQVLLNSSNDK